MRATRTAVAAGGARNTPRFSIGDGILARFNAGSGRAEFAGDGMPAAADLGCRKPTRTAGERVLTVCCLASRCPVRRSDLSRESSRMTG